MRIRNLIDLVEALSLDKVPFVRPRPDEEHDEVLYQLAAHGQEPFLPDTVKAHLEHLHDPENFQAAIRKGAVRLVSPEDARKIGNTGEDWDDADPEKKQRVSQLFRQGDPVTMPIVLHDAKTGSKWLLAGHHRLTYNSQVRRDATPALHLTYQS